MLKQEYSSAKEYWQQRAQQLKDAGLEIKIRHERVFVKTIPLKHTEVLPGNREKVIDIDYQDQILMTKAQRKFSGQTEEEKEANQLPKNPIFDGYELNNNGGCTTVTLLKDGEQIGQGISKVNPVDTFVRFYGLRNALHRAIMQSEGRLEE